MIHSFPSMLLSNNDTHSFPFLYVKTSKQDYLILFHSIHFFFIYLSYLNTFHFFMNFQTKVKEKFPKLKSMIIFMK